MGTLDQTWEERMGPWLKGFFSSVFSFVLYASGWFHANAEAAKISRFESMP